LASIGSVSGRKDSERENPGDDIAGQQLHVRPRCLPFARKKRREREREREICRRLEIFCGLPTRGIAFSRPQDCSVLVHASTIRYIYAVIRNKMFSYFIDINLFASSTFSPLLSLVQPCLNQFRLEAVELRSSGFIKENLQGNPREIGHACLGTLRYGEATSVKCKRLNGKRFYSRVIVPTRASSHRDNKRDGIYLD